MYRALAQHPAVLKPVWRKGVHYFDVDYTGDLGAYRAHFPLTITARRRAHKVGVDPVAFESSPYYLWHPLAPERISRDLPGVKTLVLVRDPVERAYSAHAHELARGYETEPFERALELEPSRLEGEEDRIRADPSYQSHAHRHQAYVRRGEYVDQVERLSSWLGRDSVHMVDSHRFFCEPETVFADVLDFLGLPWVPGLEYERHNARARLPLDEVTRERLRGHFAPYDARLTPWLGRTPSWRT